MKKMIITLCTILSLSVVAMEMNDSAVSSEVQVDTIYQSSGRNGKSFYC